MRRLPAVSGVPRRTPDGRAELPGGGSDERYLLVSRPGAFPTLPDDCLRTTTPRLRAIASRGAQRAHENAQRVRLSIVNGRGRRIAETLADEPFSTRQYGAFGIARGRSLVSGIVPDGVATVELRLRGGVVLSGRVAGNHFTIGVPFSAGAARVIGQIWRDARGRVVRR